MNDLAAAAWKRQCNVSCAACGTGRTRRRRNLVEGFRAADEPVIVRSAFGLPAKQQEAIQQAIGQVFPEGIRARFRRRGRR